MYSCPCLVRHLVHKVINWIGCRNASRSHMLVMTSRAPSMLGWPLSAPVMATVRTTTTTTITSTVTIPAGQAGLVHMQYTCRAPTSGSASAHLARGAAGRQHPASMMLVDLIEVCLEAWAGPNGQCADFRDCSYGATWNGYADAGAHSESTVCNSLSAGFHWVGATSRASAGTVGHPVSDRHHKYDSWSDTAGAFHVMSMLRAIYSWWLWCQG